MEFAKSEEHFEKFISVEGSDTLPSA